MKDLEFKVEEKFDIQLSSTAKNISVTWDTSSADYFDELVFYYCDEYYIPKTCFVSIKVSYYVANLYNNLDCPCHYLLLLVLKLCDKILIM